MEHLLGKTNVELSAELSPALGQPQVSSGQSSWQSTALAPGQVVEGRYRVLSLVARGGMGTVYHVEHLFLRKELALKVLNPNLSDVAWRRFEKEAKATSRLDHPALLAVHDFGMMDETIPFFVMDYFEGETLCHLLKRSGPLSLDKAVEVFIQVCFGLAHAHQQGVIHRDLKPSNIMLSNVDGPGPLVVKIVDFGIAKVINHADVEALALTRTGEIFGTPYYMSPEQCLGNCIDYRSDIYSLGCVLFEALTGAQPFLGDTALAIMMKHQAMTPPSLKEASMGTNLPDAIQDVVGKMLAKDPTVRYQNLFEVAADLHRVKKGAALIAKRKTRASRSERTTRRILAGTCILAAVVAAWVVVGLFNWQPDKLSQAVYQQHPDERSASNTQASSHAAVDAPDESRPYSSWSPNEPTTRFFRFPSNPDDSVGVMFDLPKGVKLLGIKDGRLVAGHRDAFGDLIMENFQPFGLRASMDLTESPRQFLRFRPDEIRTLEITNNFDVLDSALKYLSGWTALTALNLSGTKALSDKCLPYIDQIPNLTELTVSNTSITGEGLCTLKKLGKLTVLRAHSTHDAASVLPLLCNSTNLRELDLSKDALTDGDLALVGQMRNLRSLNITGDHGISGRGLLSLAGLHQLNAVSMSQQDITPECLAAIRRLPNWSVMKITPVQ